MFEECCAKALHFINKMPQSHQNTKVHKRNYIITLVKISALVSLWQVNFGGQK